jgi:hypothetical protein
VSRVLGILLNVIDIIDVFGIVVCLLDGINDDSSEREGDEHHDPAGEEFVQVWSHGGVHAEGTGGTCGLDGLVETSETGEGERVVGESGHDPVSEGLVAGIAEEVCRIGQRSNSLGSPKRELTEKEQGCPFQRNRRPCS